MRKISSMKFYPSIYTAVFDTSTMSNGIYFYRIAAGEFTAFRKTTLVK